MRGHIRQRSEGSYEIRISIGRDPGTGKKKYQYETVRGTKRDAGQRLAELLHQRDTGYLVKPGKVTVAEFLRQWLNDYVVTRVRPVTAQGYVQKIERHIIPALGGVPLADLKPGHLQSFYGKLLQGGRLDGPGGLSARTVLHMHRILHNALSCAVKWGFAPRNVAEAVDPPRARAKEMKFLSPEGVSRLLEASRDSIYYPLIHLAVYTGLRRSELLGLRWKDVDLDMATISVVQVMHCLRGGKVIFQEPKSQRGKRQVALSPVAVLALRDHRARQEGTALLLGATLKPDDILFSNPDLSPMLPNSVTHGFIKIVRRAGLGPVRLHDLRHTHASLMLAQGVHPKIVSERLGHATVSITLDTYSHVIPGLQEAAALTFERALGRADRHVTEKAAAPLTLTGAAEKEWQKSGKTGNAPKGD